jgi:hypothetical protein
MYQLGLGSSEQCDSVSADSSWMRCLRYMDRQVVSPGTNEWNGCTLTAMLWVIGSAVANARGWCSIKRTVHPRFP